MQRETEVSDLGEDRLVARFKQRFPSGNAVGVGDDAAVFTSDGPRIVFTTDVMVEHVDFDLAYMTGTDVGWKVVAANVSDIAAMGARPSVALATLTMPPSTRAGFVDDLCDGIAAAAETWDLKVLGGDLSRGTEIAVGLAVLGDVREPWLRSGAQVGDVICVTGPLGGSAAGLALLRADPSTAGPLVDSHLRPRARVDVVEALGEVPVSAAIDISDGLVVDLGRLLDASGKGCRVDPAAIPVPAGLTAVPGLQPLDAALFGGEDFELLLTIAPDDLEQAIGRNPILSEMLLPIGEVSDGDALIGDGRLNDMKEDGWDHLRRP